LQAKSWAEKYRPLNCASLLGNEEAVLEFKSWLRSWTSKRKAKRKAALLVGPPGVGKTSLARAGAYDFHLRVVELNASDVRTEKAIERALLPATTSLTLDTYSKSAEGNLILLDEVDGVFGREDRGGLGAILSILDDSPIPIVLTANDVEDERFDDLRKKCSVIELFQIRPRLLLMLVSAILDNEHAKVSQAVLEVIVRRSAGDIRSAINDVQSAAAGTFDSTGVRTKQLDEMSTLKSLLESQRFGQARRALNETEIPIYGDQLLLLIHDVLPYLYTSPLKLARAYETISRADIAYARVGVNRSRAIAPPPFNIPRLDSVPQWSLLPVALNELASVGMQQVDNDLEHALTVSSRPSKKTIERYQYRLWSIDHVCGRLAKACHISKRSALHTVFPTLVSLLRANDTYGKDIAASLQLEERDIEFLTEEAKATASTGPVEILDPAGFKLPYMGKDKFVQLMRAGIRYDSSAREFSVRRMDNLDYVEETVSQIVGKQVKFLRPEQAQTIQGTSQKTLKICYVDSKEISCEACEFLEDCPTHYLQDLRYCLCTETLADKKAYEKYVAKTISETAPAKSLKKASKKKA